MNLQYILSQITLVASCHKANIIVAGKHPSPQWLSIGEATSHCSNGVSVWEWASNDRGVMPHVILCAAGDVPPLEALAATSILQKKLPQLKIRFINVVNLMKLVLPGQVRNTLRLKTIIVHFYCATFAYFLA